MYPQTQVEQICKKICKQNPLHSVFKFWDGKVRFTIYFNTSTFTLKPVTKTFTFAEILSCYKNPYTEFNFLWEKKEGE